MGETSLVKLGIKPVKADLLTKILYCLINARMVS